MVGWEKPVTRYNKNNNNRTITKICIVTRSAVHTYAGDQECWRSRMAKREREEFEVSEVAPLQPLSR